MIQRHVHPIRERQVQAAKLAVFVATVGEVEHAAGFELASQATDQQQR